MACRVGKRNRSRVQHISSAGIQFCPAAAVTNQPYRRRILNRGRAPAVAPMSSQCHASGWKVHAGLVVTKANPR